MRSVRQKIELAINVNHAATVEPDLRPFVSPKDAYERLFPFHVHKMRLPTSDTEREASRAKFEEAHVAKLRNVVGGSEQVPGVTAMLESVCRLIAREDGEIGLVESALALEKAILASEKSELDQVLASDPELKHKVEVSRLSGGTVPVKTAKKVAKSGRSASKVSAAANALPSLPPTTGSSGQAVSFVGRAAVPPPAGNGGVPGGPPKLGSKQTIPGGLTRSGSLSTYPSTAALPRPDNLPPRPSKNQSGMAAAAQEAMVARHNALMQRKLQNQRAAAGVPSPQQPKGASAAASATPASTKTSLSLERMYQNGLRQYSEGLKAEFKKKVEAVKRESEAGMYQVMRDPALDPEERQKRGNNIKDLYKRRAQGLQVEYQGKLERAPADFRAHFNERLNAARAARQQAGSAARASGGGSGNLGGLGRLGGGGGGGGGGGSA